jgi:hypothetical protein
VIGFLSSRIDNATGVTTAWGEARS